MLCKIKLRMRKIYQKKSWLRMPSLSSKLDSRSAPRDDEEGRLGSEATESRRLWNRAGSEDCLGLGNNDWWLSPM